MVDSGIVLEVNGGGVLRCKVSSSVFVGGSIIVGLPFFAGDSGLDLFYAWCVLHVEALVIH